MSQRKAPLIATRREFLKTLGTLTGGVAASRIVGLTPDRKAYAQSVAQAGYHCRIGLLLPESHLNPMLGQNLMTGMKLGLSEAGCPGLELVTQAYRGGQSAAAAKAEKLMDEHQVDLVTGVASPNLSEELRGIVEARRTHFVVTDAGANLVRSSERSPFVLYNSLDYWQSNWAMGQWAAQNLGMKAVVVSSFYETGYDAFSAFRLGFEAGGGEVAATHVTHRPASDWTWESVLSGVRKVAPDFVFGLYSGEPAVEFVQAWAAYGLAGQVPLLSSPFMVDESLLPALGDAALGIRSCLSWAPGMHTAENQSFMAAFRKMAGRTPDAYALLGYDTARLILTALGAAGGRVRGTDGLTGALAAARWSTPRGAVKLDATTQSVVTPLYLREVRRGADGLYNAVVGTIAPADDRDARLEPLRSGERTGWLNSYLHV